MILLPQRSLAAFFLLCLPDGPAVVALDDSSFTSERACKALVRPHYDPASWSKDELHKRPWPTRHPHMRSLAARRLGPTDALDALDRPARFSHAIETAWPDHAAWSRDALAREYADVPVAVGADEGNWDVVMPLRDYLNYAARQVDDSPLYVFDDALLDEGGAAAPLAASFAPPPAFPHDWMRVLGDSRYGRAV